ncbi:hypothetical protein M409DRAFT_59429 [Zasmidium cellare ATCC 36951]|uniref:Xaa-Pro dipeptidyl-peptidase C-terminal domain-containing protein n=1 Tax=Zasmidium cellare ATCC 36951 TaxID=1080233 RepID=A0A6A6C262_ZASCE|nr:uncharacterized protein M409DRAFT_59429 [Zasmidium cellare ATCC 36951]KAF2161174.1 hypothetical protein M409DRAFT_59429 [Zasmidium cellare ATCC 36951]
MIIERDVPIKADDGLVLRANVFRSDDEKTPCPVVMVMGPYGKGVEYKEGYAEQWKWVLEHHPDLLPGSTRSYMTWEVVDPEIWVPWGYACIQVDSRGTGRTPGKIDIFSAREVKDFYDAIEWAGTQPWSNGKVGLNGISYYAMNQWLVAGLQPPHLTAMIPWEGAADCYRDFMRHGGIVSNTFYENWFPKQILSNQHGNPAGYTDPWMNEKATGPENLSEEELQANWVNCIAEALQRPTDDDWYRERSPVWDRVVTPFLSASNWGGHGLHGRGNTEGFTRAASKEKWLEIHAGRHDEGFYLNEAMALQRRFFDYYLKGIDNGWKDEPRVQLQMRRPGAPFGEHKKDTAWPLPNTKWTEMYFSASNKALSTSTPSAEEEATFSAEDGEVVFQTEPLSEETEFTGPFTAKLFISSTTADADLFLTVQVFSPQGKEVDFQGGWDPRTPISQGWLRASHRKLDHKLSTPYRPYHSHDEEQPLEAGEVYEVDVELWPGSIILPKCYHLSLMVSGRDFRRPEALADNSLNWRQKGSGPFLHDHPEDRGREAYKGKTTVYTGGDRASYLLAPIIPK